MVRLGFIVGLIGLIGVLLSGGAAWRVYHQELAIDRIAFARAVDVHASLVQDRLTERELLARVASGLFRAPAAVKANMLQPLRSSIYAFKADFVVAAWIARLKPGEFAAAQRALADESFANSVIRDFDDRPLDVRAIDKPVNVLMDLEPRNAETVTWPGRVLDSHSIVGPTLAKVLAEESPSPPTPSRCCARRARSASCLPPPCCRTVRSRPASSLSPTKSGR